MTFYILHESHFCPTSIWSHCFQLKFGVAFCLEIVQNHVSIQYTRYIIGIYIYMQIQQTDKVHLTTLHVYSITYYCKSRVQNACTRGLIRLICLKQCLYFSWQFCASKTKHINFLSNTHGKNYSSRARFFCSSPLLDSMYHKYPEIIKWVPLEIHSGVKILTRKSSYCHDPFTYVLTICIIIYR